MKSPVYTVHPCLITKQNQLNPCDESHPHKIGYTVFMQEEGSSLLHESGHLYDSLVEAQEAAHDLGCIQIIEYFENGIRQRIENFSTPEDILNHLQYIGQDKQRGFSSVLAFELYWGASGQELKRQWRLEID